MLDSSLDGSGSSHKGDHSIGHLIRNARARVGVSQRALAERSGMSLRAIREIEQGRVHTPRASSLRRLAEVLEESELFAHVADHRAYGAQDPLVLQILGKLTVSRGPVDLNMGTPKQQNLLALLALRANQVVERDEIVDVLWGDDLPDSFSQLIHTYVYRIRMTLKEHRQPKSGLSIVRRGTGYELQADEGELDLLSFRGLLKSAETARLGGDLSAEQDLLDRALKLWRGRMLEGAGRALREHPVVVDCAEQQVACAMRFADLAVAQGQYRKASDRLRPLAQHNPLHEGLHARLITALAGSGQRVEALELFTALDRRLRQEYGIEPGAELRATQMSVLREESRPVASVTAADLPDRAARPCQLPPAVSDFVGRTEHHRILQHLSGAGSQAAFSAPPVATLYGPPGVGKSTLAIQVALAARPYFPDGILYADMGGAPLGTGKVLGQFLHALGVPSGQIPDGLPERTALYRSLLASGPRILIVVDSVVQESAVRPLLPSGNGSAMLLTSWAPLAGLEGARHFRITLLDTDQALTLLERIIGEYRVRQERAAAELIVDRCGHLPLAVRIVGLRLATHPHWTLAYMAARLEDERYRLHELVQGDLNMSTRFALSCSVLDTTTRQALRVLARSCDASFTLASAADVLGYPVPAAERILEKLVDHQFLEAPADEEARYTFLPLSRTYAMQ